MTPNDETAIAPSLLDLTQVFVLFLFVMSWREARTAPKAQRARSARGRKFLSLPCDPFILRCLRYSEIKTETCSKSTSLRIPDHIIVVAVVSTVSVATSSLAFVSLCFLSTWKCSKVLLLLACSSFKMAVNKERYLLFLAEEVPKDAKDYLFQCIESHGLVAEEESCPGQSVIVVGAPFNTLCEEVRRRKKGGGPFPLLRCVAEGHSPYKDFKIPEGMVWCKCVTMTFQLL